MLATFSDGAREERVLMSEPKGASKRHVGIVWDNCRQGFRNFKGGYGIEDVALNCVAFMDGKVEFVGQLRQ